VPGEVVDCLVGLAVREAAVRALSVDSSLWSGWKELDQSEQREFALLHRALDEVYVAARLSRLSKALSGYLRAMRDMLGPADSQSPESGQGIAVTRDAVLRGWLRSRLFGRSMPSPDTSAAAAAIHELDMRAGRYLSTRSPLRRLELAGEIWTWLAGFPRAEPGADWWLLWAADAPSYEQGQSTRQQMRDNLRGGSEAGSLIDMTRYLAELSPGPPAGVREEVPAVRGEVELVTDELRELGVRAAVTAMKDARFDLDDYERVCSEMAPEIGAMRHVFSRLDDVRARWRYGLRRGRIDGRGLTKVAAGKTNVFKSRDRQRGSSMALVFLVDVSASMRSYMTVVNRAACVVSEALRELAPRVWYEVVTYTSGGLHPGAPVQMTRLAASGMKLSLRDVWSDGGTPTGEAIAAALLTLRRRQAARKLVLHFTDGHPKDTYVVRQALELCRRFGVDVLTVSVGASQDMLYGVGKCEVAYSVPELTSVLARVLPRIYRP
jgi:Mg-chelatase subunit ChlD